MSKSFEANQTLPSLRKCQKKSDVGYLVKSEHSISYSTISTNSLSNTSRSYGSYYLDESSNNFDSSELSNFPFEHQHGVLNPYKIVLSLDNDNKVSFMFCY